MTKVKKYGPWVIALIILGGIGLVFGFPAVVGTIIIAMYAIGGGAAIILWAIFIIGASAGLKRMADREDRREQARKEQEGK